jgi:hypothetical protein
MITSEGKELIAKYLLGQAPSYASHISIGCGATPLSINLSQNQPYDFNSYFLKEKMDFEMLRLPIVSRGIVTENGINKISLIAEVPTENRYEITELGLWSSPNNSLARGFDSRIIFDFQSGWEAHGPDQDPLSSGSIIVYPIELIPELGVSEDIEDQDKLIFRARTSDPVLQVNNRKQRKEGPRFLNTSIFMRGDSSVIEGEDGAWELTEDSTHIHLNTVNLNIDRNSASDVFSFSFSLINKSSLAPQIPLYAKILIEFYTSETNQQSGFAKKEIYIDGSDFSNNSYKVVSFPISELITSPDFTSSRIRIARISSSVVVQSGENEDTSASHYIALDGFRIDNISTANPLYKMTGYSVIRNANAFPAIKLPNSNNYVEFRFALQVDQAIGGGGL